MKIRMLKNKRGDKYLSPFWILILAIVAVGIFGMVYVFYGSPYDVREIEANVLLNQVADCVSYAGKINANLISNSQFNPETGESLLKDCHLNFTSSEWKEEQYYTQINFYKLTDLNNPVLNVSAGNSNFLSDCEIQKYKEQQNLPKCMEKAFYSLDNANNQYIIKILTAVSKSEKNVRL
jgi:hypothetical protein